MRRLVPDSVNNDPLSRLVDFIKCAVFPDPKLPYEPFLFPWWLKIDERFSVVS
jgi:hypothetical protein